MADRNMEYKPKAVKRGDENSKSQKRLSEGGCDDVEPADSANSTNSEADTLLPNLTKRFCGDAAAPSQNLGAEKKTLESSLKNSNETDLVKELHSNKKKLLHSRVASCYNNKTVLSPITELSNSLSQSSLQANVDVPQRKQPTVPMGSPLSSLSALGRRSSSLILRLAGSENGPPTQETVEQSNEDSSELLEENNEGTSNDFELSSNPSTSSGDSGTNLRAMHTMHVDEESLYENDALLCASPQLMRLLTPDRSPIRFRIVENKLMPDVVKPPLPLGNDSNLQANNEGSAQHGLRMTHSLSSGSTLSTNSLDSEYMDSLFDMETLQSQAQTILHMPSDFSSLISGQIKDTVGSTQPITLEAKTPEFRRASARRCLSLTDSLQNQLTPEVQTRVQDSDMDSATTPFSSKMSAEEVAAELFVTTPTGACFKRPDPPSAPCSPMHNKRIRSGYEKENNGSLAYKVLQKNVITRPPLRKSMSMNDAEIMSALTRSENSDDQLIGDFSKPFILPLMEGRHRDLKSVSSDTVARLLKGEFNDQVASYQIIDCRYPYEFEGGHIRGAKNLYTPEQILREFMEKQKTDTDAVVDSSDSRQKRNIIIFHCEFSSERGPKLSRFLRDRDRVRNTNSYPALDYPEMYLLHNGYKEFFETHSELCDPVSYRPMLEPAYTEAYRHFRAKSKSWNGDGLGGASTRLKKSRSRLLL